MRKKLKRLMTEEDGLSVVEFALLVAVFALVIAVGSTSMGRSLFNSFQYIGGAVDVDTSASSGS